MSMREKLGLVFCHEIVNDLVINKGGQIDVGAVPRSGSDRRTRPTGGHDAR